MAGKMKNFVINTLSMVPFAIPLKTRAVFLFLCGFCVILIPQRVYPQLLNWEQVNSDGFGSNKNFYGYHMSVFGDLLYLSTYNEASGTEIWRSPNGINWEQINSDGFGNSNNIAGGFVGFGNFLYFLTINKTTGTEIWRTQNGLNWEQVNIDGFGDRNNISASGHIVYGSFLYISTFNEASGTEIWRSPNGINWEQINSDGFGNSNNFEGICIPFGSYLYCMVGSYSAFEVWRTLDGISWENVNNGGWEDATAVAGYSVFENFMYISTCPNAKIWRTNDGKTWYRVSNGSNGSNICSNFPMKPNYTFQGSLYFSTTNNVTGLEVWKNSVDANMWNQVVFSGFDDPHNTGGLLVVFGDYLYGVTSNHSTGTEVWRTQNGLNWEQVNIDGFGDVNNSMFGNIVIFKDSLYIATYNAVTGTELWKTDKLYIKVKANSQNGPIVVSSGTAVSVTVSLSPGEYEAQNADWWVAESTPSGTFNHYDLSTGSMVPGLLPTHQGPLFTLGTTYLLNSSDLTVGTHAFYFGVDLNMNGSLDMDSIYYDWVTVNVTGP